MFAIAPAKETLLIVPADKSQQSAIVSYIVLWHSGAFVLSFTPHLIR
jgi:hypothetical protein